MSRNWDSQRECRLPDYAAFACKAAVRGGRANAYHWAERHNQSPSRKASNGSGGRYRFGVTPDGVAWARASSLNRMSACKYTWVVSVDSWPSHSAMTVRSTPRRSNAIAAACRNVWGVTFLALSD